MARETYVLRDGKLVTKAEAVAMDAAKARKKRGKGASVKVRRAQTGTWVMRDGVFVPKAQAMAMAGAGRKRSHLSAPSIRRDEMEGFTSNISGETRYFDSKSQWEKHVDDNGYEILGNEEPYAAERTLVDSDDVKADIATALEMVEQGYRPDPGEADDTYDIDEIAATGQTVVRGGDYVPDEE